MIVKFFSGKGNAKSSADYLIGKNHDRDQAKEIKGDIRLTQSIAEQTTFNHQITVGCLSFEEKNIPENEKTELMERFENTFLAGLDKENYSIAWVEHTDKDRLELNFYIANVELETGKRLVPYFHSADLPLKDNFQTVVNYEYGYTNPLDPKKSQLISQDKALPKTAKEIQDHFHTYFSEQIENGVITERDQIVEHLEKMGLEISRQTDNSISIKNPDGGRNIRLKGAMYAKEFFNGELAQEIGRSEEKHRSGKSGISEKDYVRSLNTLQAGIERKEQNHKEKYRGKSIRSREGFNPIQRVIEEEQGTDQQRNRTEQRERIEADRNIESEHITGHTEDSKRERERPREIDNEESFRDRDFHSNATNFNDSNRRNDIYHEKENERDQPNFTTITEFRVDLDEQKRRLREKRERIERNKLTDQHRKELIERSRERGSRDSESERERERLSNRNLFGRGHSENERRNLSNDQTEAIIKEHNEISGRNKADIGELQRTNRTIKSGNEKLTSTESIFNQREKLITKRESELKSRIDNFERTEPSGQGIIQYVKDGYSKLKDRARELFERFTTHRSTFRESATNINSTEQLIDRASEIFDKTEQRIDNASRESQRIVEKIQSQEIEKESRGMSFGR